MRYSLAVKKLFFPLELIHVSISVLQTNRNLQNHPALHEYDTNRTLYSGVSYENIFFWISGKTVFTVSVNSIQPLFTVPCSAQLNSLFLFIHAACASQIIP